MKVSKSVLAAITVFALAAQTSLAAELKPDTLAAWNAYMTDVDFRVQQRNGSHVPFLWMDESPDRAARVRRGEVVVAPVVRQGTEDVPTGLIHDWIGAIFIPGATIDSLLATVHDYDNYERVYRPVVSSSKTLGCTATSQEFLMVWQRRVLFISAAMQGRYRAREVMLDSHSGYSVADAVELREIRDYGHSSEHLLTPDTGSGFIWRIRSIARFEQRDGGVYLELEAIALTRDIPASLGWMVNPVVKHLSINSLTTTLRQTRDAVILSERNPEALAMCTNPHTSTTPTPGTGE